MSQEDYDLAQQLANPVVSLISVPFQFNYDDGIRPGGDGSRLVLTDGAQVKKGYFRCSCLSLGSEQGVDMSMCPTREEARRQIAYGEKQERKSDGVERPE